MRLFLVRHADADAEIPEGLGDEARSLNTKVRGAIAQHFAANAERIGSIGLILTSPLVRTVQTAQLLSVSTKHEGSLRAHRSLLPDMPVGAVEPVLEEHKAENLALVGHQPTMGALAAHLLGMQSFPKAVTPGTVIALERVGEGETPKFKFLFYATPGHPVVDTLQ